MEGVNPQTVWTWNAIGKTAGTWGLDPKAPEAKEGFLLNPLDRRICCRRTATATDYSNAPTR